MSTMTTRKQKRDIGVPKAIACNKGFFVFLASFSPARNINIPHGRPNIRYNQFIASPFRIIVLNRKKKGLRFCQFLFSLAIPFVGSFLGLLASSKGDFSGHLPFVFQNAIDKGIELSFAIFFCGPSKGVFILLDLPVAEPWRYRE
jgi:hypothetical protein